MGHSLAVAFESLAQILHQAVDSTPERMFHLLSGIVLIAVGLSVRRSLQ